jgi:flagellar FliL protein
MNAAPALGMSEHAAEGPKDGADKKDKKKKEGGAGFSNLLLVILGLVNFLAVAGLGAYIVLGLGQHPQAAAQPGAAKPEGAEGEEHGEPKEGEGGGHGEAKEGEGGHGEGAAAETHGENHSAAGGPLLALETIVTNLSEPDSDRYLKITVQLRITSESARAEVEAYMVPIRSQILMLFSSLNLGDLRGSEAKQTLQARVKRLINETMPSSRVTHVYFTELVIQ